MYLYILLSENANDSDLVVVYFWFISISLGVTAYFSPCVFNLEGAVLLYPFNYYF